MEIGAKLASLEEEVSVLKNEIKAILKEVRIAVLAQENPFARVAVNSSPVAPAPPQEPQAPREAPRVVPLREGVEAPAEPGSAVEEAPLAPKRRPVHREPEAAPPPPVRPPRRWSMTKLAALMAWTQDTAEQLTAAELAIVLSLARYGGVIDTELEETLVRLAANADQPQGRPRASVSEFVLALRELDALLNEEETGVNARRAAQAS